MKYSRLILLARFALTGLAVWVAGVVCIDSYGFRDQAQPADVIVVLGSQVFPGGRPGPSLTRRARHAAALWQQGLASDVLCTGGLGDNPPTEAEAACQLVGALGVPAEALTLETRSHSTEENALYTTEIMRAHGWRTAIIVSDGYHLLRAQVFFSRAGVTGYPSPAQLTGGSMNPIERLYRANRELAALLWYGGKTLLGWQVTDFP